MGRKAKGGKGSAETPSGQQREQLAERPELLFPDELGFETLEYRCWKCARLQYREKNTAEALLRNGHKLFCMPCQRPDLFEWEVETLQDGSKREYIRPLSAKETLKHLSPEARALAQKQAMAQILRARAQAILALTRDLELEYMGLLPAIEQAEKDVVEAQVAVQVLDNDDALGKKVRSVQELNASIMRLVSEIEAAKAAQAKAAEKGAKQP